MLSAKQRRVALRKGTVIAGVILLVAGAVIVLAAKASAPGFAVAAAGAILVALGLSRSQSSDA
jgi:hypothetical protein